VNVASQETVGNYLELVRSTEARVFLDDRVDMYPEAVVEDFLVLLRGRPGWREVLERREVDVVVWEANQPLASLLADDPAWRTVYADGTWIVACHRPSEALQAAAAAGATPC
jgi:hypothetical protein